MNYLEQKATNDLINETQQKLHALNSLGWDVSEAFDNIRDIARANNAVIPKLEPISRPLKELELEEVDRMELEHIKKAGIYA